MNAWHHLPDLYFLHIPKTAGTSVRAWAEGLFPHDAILPAHHINPMEALPDEIILKCRFASGHFGWRFVERAESLGREIEVFTFLRDVVGLHMSLLGYAPHIPEDVFDKVSASVAETLRSTAAMAGNPKKIKFITETEFDVEERLRANPGPIPGQNPFVLHMMGAGAQDDGKIEMTAALVDEASRRLHDVFMVGLVEDMAGSFALLCHRLGLPYVPLGRTLNKTEKKLKPSESYSELVRRRNPHDLRLYEEAGQRLESSKAELFLTYGAASVEELAAPMRAAFLATERGVARIGEAEITMADGLVSEGLAPRFFFEDYQRWIRWAGRQSTLYLPLDTSSDRNVRFEIATTMNDVIRDGLTLSVNGHDIPLTRSYETWPDDAFHVICEGTIPAAAMQPGAQYTALDLAAPEDVETDYPESMGARAAFALADISIA